MTNLHRLTQLVADAQSLGILRDGFKPEKIIHQDGYVLTGFIFDKTLQIDESSNFITLLHSEFSNSKDVTIEDCEGVKLSGESAILVYVKFK